jgi:hypothetical protein
MGDARGTAIQFEDMRNPAGLRDKTGLLFYELLGCWVDSHIFVIQTTR